MGRALRVDVGGEVYHVLNRANARVTIFTKQKGLLSPWPVAEPENYSKWVNRPQIENELH